MIWPGMSGSGAGIRRVWVDASGEEHGTIMSICSIILARYLRLTGRSKMGFAVSVIWKGKKYPDYPVVACGGFASGQGLASALAMGADAVCFGSAIMATKESPAPDSWRRQVLTQDIFDEKFYKKIYHLQLRDSAIGSMEIGHINEETSIKAFIDNIVLNAEKILRDWGVEGDEYKTF